jgi:hypothetical protein
LEEQPTPTFHGRWYLDERPPANLYHDGHNEEHIARTIAEKDRIDPMDVQVTIDLSVAAQEKHFEQMRSAASYLTDDSSSVKVSYASDDRKKLEATFTVPAARQADVVDVIGRKFWCVETIRIPRFHFPAP